jgi:L-alanine-DL-glutamate epimerase-like enolase superfamily enzyme
MNITINSIEIYKSKIKLKKPFIISLGQLEFAENVIILINTNKGITGYGECSPFMTINGESQETCLVVARYLAKVLIGKNPINIAECSALMDKVIYGNSSIKSAFDMALYDIAAKDAGQSLYQYLGGNNDKEIVTDYTISLDYPEKMAEDARWIRDHGYEIIKVKLGHSKEQDLECIHKIRQAIGPDVLLRADANQGWSVENAPGILQELAQYDIQHCEEPIPRCEFMELPKIRKSSPIPIMADETCFDHHDAKRLLAMGVCDSINVKLGKSSGIFKALKIMELAKQANMPIQIGGFMESRLGFTAAAHLAMVSDQAKYFDFDTPLMQEEDPVVGGIEYGEKGKITLPEGPGLGATIDERFLSRLEKVVVE